MQQKERKSIEVKEEKIKKYSYDQARHNDLVGSLKNCIEHTLNLYKMMDVSPKNIGGIHDVVEYCKSLERMLSKALVQAAKNMVPLTEFKRMEEKYRELEQQYAILFRENKDFKCDIDVLEKIVAEGEKRQKQLEWEKEQLQKSSIFLERQVQKIKKDSEEGIQKIIQANKSSKSLSSKKSSLPVINYHTTREKLGLLFLMESPTRRIKTNRMLDYKKK